MKKILLIPLLLLTSLIYGQLPADSADWTTSTTNAQYGLVFDDGPPKLMKRMTMEYYQPMVYSGGLVRPRSIATSLLVGSTTNPWSNRFYVNGTLRSSGNAYFMNRVYLGTLGTSYLSADESTGVITIYDPVTGSKTLADLSTGGGGTDIFDSTATTLFPKILTNSWNFGGNSSTAYKLKVTGTLNTTSHIYAGAYIYLAGAGGAYGVPKFYASGDTMKLSDVGGTYSLADLVNSNGLSVTLNECATCDTFWVASGSSPAYRVVSSFGGGGNVTTDLNQIAYGLGTDSVGGNDKFRILASTMRVENTTADSGLYALNSHASGKAIVVRNTAGGHAISSYNTSNGIGGYFSTSSSGDALYAITTSTGFGLRVTDGSGTIFSVTGDSAFLPQLAAVNEQWLGISETGGIFADSLANASFMLTLSPFPTIEDHMKDIRDGELAWYYHDGEMVRKSYGISQIPKIRWRMQALMAGIEMNKRYILELKKENQAQDAEIFKLKNDLEILKFAVGKLLEEKK